MIDVVGYEDLFRVTEDGRLWSKRTQKFLKQTKLKTGYMTVASKIGGRKGVCICLRVHVAVAKAYIYLIQIINLLLIIKMVIKQITMFPILNGLRHQKIHDMLMIQDL